MARKVKRAKAKSRLEGQVLGELLRKHPEILNVLDKHGVSFCAGCYLTLFSTPGRVAAYHAVLDLKRFLGDLRQATGKKRSY